MNCYRIRLGRREFRHPAGVISRVIFQEGLLGGRLPNGVSVGQEVYTLAAEMELIWGEAILQPPSRPSIRPLDRA